jgi:multisubunit Na+/H+ antiporter MnhB subunit
MGDDADSHVRSYLQLRRAIGFLGMLLPVILPVGVLMLAPDEGWQPTISDYVDTVMGGAFVGILFAIGVFLYFYVGYDPDPGTPRFLPSDKLASNLGGLFAIAVALFPTTSSVGFVQGVHATSAGLLFLVLAYFALWQFTKTGGDTTPEKIVRNRIYRICGVTILVCVGLILINGWLLRDTSLADVKPVFWLESIALWAFGVAWFVKGEGVPAVNDDETPPELVPDPD